MTILTRRKRTSFEKSFSKSVPKRKKRDYTMAVKCNTLLVVKALKLLTCMGQLRLQDNKPTAKQTIPTSISRSLREYFASTSSSHNHLTELKRLNWPTPNRSWWSLVLIGLSLHTEHSFWPSSELANSMPTTCWKYSQKSKHQQLSLIMSVSTASILNTRWRSLQSYSQNIRLPLQSKVRPTLNRL